MSKFYVYMLKCSDDSYYIGRTDDLEKRIAEHNAALYIGYTTTRLSVELVYSQDFSSRYEAIIAEQKIKKWSRAKKEALIGKNWHLISMLAKKKF